MAFTLEDRNGNELLVVGDDGKFAFSRYNDMDEGTKKKLIKMYSALSGQSVDGFKKFLDFEGDEEDSQFCS